MFKLVVLAALLAFAAAKPAPGTLITNPAYATGPLTYSLPLAYSSNYAYTGYAPAYYRPGLAAAPIAYTDYAPLALI